jgi:hypothetical protein
MNSALPYIAKEEEKKKEKKRKITITSHRVRINGQPPRRSEEDYNKPSYKKQPDPRRSEEYHSKPSYKYTIKTWKKKKKKRKERGKSVNHHNNTV